MSFVDQQGHVANLNGQKLERLITNYLRTSGFKVLSYVEWVLEGRPDNTVIKNYQYKNAYGTYSRADMIIRCKAVNMEFTKLECRSQVVRGSVDEKLPTLIDHAMAKDSPDHTIIVLGGGGARRGSIELLKTRAQQASLISPHKVIQVFEQPEEFTKWFDSLRTRVNLAPRHSKNTWDSIVSLTKPKQRKC